MHHKEFLFCSVPSLCPNEQNTAYKAANLFLNIAKSVLLFPFILKTDSQSGRFGRRSADAAAVLHGLNQLFQNQFDTEATV